MMYSSGFDHGTRFEDHGRNMMIAAGLMFIVAQVPPQRLMSVAVPLFWWSFAEWRRSNVVLSGLASEPADRAAR